VYAICEQGMEWETRDAAALGESDAKEAKRRGHAHFAITKSLSTE
jgi:hypothetical protein